MADKVPETAAAKVTAAAKSTAAPAKGKAASNVKEATRRKATGVREEMIERQQIGSFGIWVHDSIRQAPSWLVSTVVHMIVLFILALTVYSVDEDETHELFATPVESEEIEEIEEPEELEEPEDFEMDVTDELVSSEMETVIDEMPEPAYSDPVDDGTEPAPLINRTAPVGTMTGTGLGGRGRRRKGGGGGGDGRTPGSETAVDKALIWLKNHQLPDGGWSFDHTLSSTCGGKCKGPGKMAEARNGATALALLPFLGAGETHKEGKYKPQVGHGLYYLIREMKHGPKGGSLHEGGGRMYSHGLASIALCEAFAMTHDKALEAPAQQAINFICSAQDPRGGGWRYNPGQPGDTSVVGWQIMALKSGHMAYLAVPPAVVGKASVFLDFVQSDSGARYGYTKPGNGHATTAIGLLCRMYLGWKKDNPALERGCQHLSNWGPDIDGNKANMYYNYYATQVMRHYYDNDDPIYEKWNLKMRDGLVNSQVGPGSHEEGSWSFGGGHNATGGRLYTTAMATMILEVYYRHMPIYGKQSTEEEFPD